MATAHDAALPLCFAICDEKILLLEEILIYSYTFEIPQRRRKWNLGIVSHVRPSKQSEAAIVIGRYDLPFPSWHWIECLRSL